MQRQPTPLQPLEVPADLQQPFRGVVVIRYWDPVKQTQRQLRGGTVKVRLKDPIKDGARLLKAIQKIVAADKHF